jgi:phosphoglycolate phosphatase
MIDLEVKYITQCGRLYNGVIECLQHLKKENHQIALCSNAVPAYQQAVFSKTGIGNYFDIVRLPQSSEDTKVKMVKELLASANHQEINMIIGDRIHDIEAGKLNKIHTIGCNYGYGGNEINEADYIVQSASDLKEVISLLLNAE